MNKAILATALIASFFSVQGFADDKNRVVVIKEIDEYCQNIGINSNHSGCFAEEISNEDKQKFDLYTFDQGSTCTIEVYPEPGHVSSFNAKFSFSEKGDHIAFINCKQTQEGNQIGCKCSKLNQLPKN